MIRNKQTASKSTGGKVFPLKKHTCYIREGTSEPSPSPNTETNSTPKQSTLQISMVTSLANDSILCLQEISNDNKENEADTLNSTCNSTLSVQLLEGSKACSKKQPDKLEEIGSLSAGETFSVVFTNVHSSPDALLEYLIPQSMLASSTDEAKSSDDTASADETLEFEIEDAADKTGMEALSPIRKRPRRKTPLVPKTDDLHQPDLEVELKNSPPRPKLNTDLINKLALHRVMVKHLLEKLNVPAIDFNQNSDDDYIDVYNIYKG